VKRFGFDVENYTRSLALALGTQSVNPLQLAAAYAVLANGGYRVEPYLIQRIDDMEGNPVWEARPPTVCRNCEHATIDDALLEQELSMEEILSQHPAGNSAPPPAERVMDERVNFIVNNILQDVITQGTGRRARVLERRDIAGKTGTTNGPMDAWFSGFNRDVVTTTWVGFDEYTPLGRREFGGTAALPIWIQYMREALADSPDTPRPLPPGIVRVRIDPDSGLLAAPGQGNAIWEYFRSEYVPSESTAGEEQGPGLRGTDDLIRDIF
jgi:penicillin-binding protein 1A